MEEKQSIWIVDDEIELAEIYSEFLQSRFSTRIFHSASDVLSAFENEPEHPAILVSDIRMPKMDGIDLLEQLRQRNIKTPTVLMSGYTEKHHLVRASQLQLSGFMEKPFDPNNLEALLAELILESKTSQLRDQLLALYRMKADRSEELMEKYVSRYIFAESRMHGAPDPVFTEPQEKLDYLNQIRAQNVLERNLEEIERKIQTLLTLLSNA